MSQDFSAFDPLTSPVANSASSAATSAAAAATAAQSAASSDAYYVQSKWHSKKSSATHSYALSFAAAKPRVEEQSVDPVAKLVAEAEAKAAADAKAAAEAAAEEAKRQEEAKAAAAAGKEAIGEDAKTVELPGELNTAGRSRQVSASPPVDATIAKAQQAAEKLQSAHDAEIAARNRYADRSTFHYSSQEDNKSTDPPVLSSTSFDGAADFSDKSKIVLSDVTKTVVKAGGQPTTTEVPGTFTLSVSEDKKKITGTLSDESIDFEIIDTQSGSADLASILGY